MTRELKPGFSIPLLICTTILLLPFLVHAQTPLLCGQPQPGSIGTAGQKDFYTFTASANDAVTIRARRISGNLLPQLELYGPGNSFLASLYHQIDRKLTATGTYTVLLRDGFNVNTGQYLLYWERLNSPCTVAGSLQCGQTVTGTIGTGMGPPAWRVHTITAAASDVVSISARNISGGSFIPLMELYGPAGDWMVSRYNYPLEQGLTAAGTYRILVRDYYNAYAGTYALRFQKNNNSCLEVTIGSPNGGELIWAGSAFPITWTCTSPKGVSSQEIRFSPDGGQTYSEVIASGLGAKLRFFDWKVPSGTLTDRGRIRIAVTDDSGVSTPDESDGDFVIGSRRAYEYDDLGRLSRITYEDGSVVSYTYDPAGNRIEVK